MPTTKYVWDEDNVLYETDGADVVTAEYTNSPEQYGDLISEYRSGTTFTHYADAQGSTVALTNDAGTVTDTFLYSAWGEEVARTGSTATPFRWIGQIGYYWDSERALFYVRRRSYLAPLGRWIQFDPLGASVDLALYEYVSNTPTLYTDPSGMKAVKASLECPKNGLSCSCDDGKCEFELSIDNKTSRICFKHTPGWYTHISPPSYTTCESDINRSDEMDYMTFILKDGTVCTYDREDFPPFDTWPPKPLFFMACDGLFTLKPLPGVVGHPEPHTGGCYDWSHAKKKIAKVKVSMNMEITCSCSLGPINTGHLKLEETIDVT